MHILPRNTSEQYTINKKNTYKLAQKRSQDGIDKPCYLLSIPQESLTYITSYLDPVSLSSLSRTCRALHNHVDQDNTWHRAFACQYLAATPETEITIDRTLLLSRIDSTWKKEYIYRWNLQRRWQRSRNPTVAHSPHYSNVSSMHLMSEHARGGPSLLSASLQYGIVSRSHPLTGKILKGYLDASGTLNGIGIGNPNAEFSPSVSACALTSDGGTAKVLWGYFNGEVAITTAQRAMDHNRTPAKLIRCQVANQHASRVVDIAWAAGGSACLSASTDGTVKLWDTKRLQCLWTSEKPANTISAIFVKVISELKLGVVVAVTSSRTVLVWSGLPTPSQDSNTIPEIHFPVSLISCSIPPESENAVRKCDSVNVHVDAQSVPSKLVLVVHFDQDPRLYRLDVNLNTRTWDYLCLTGEVLGPIRSMFPFAVHGDQLRRSALLVGDQLGRVNVFDMLKTQPGSIAADGTTPYRTLDAHDDGAVTCLSCTPTILATGSSRGTVKIWDTLTFELLRSFTSVGPKPPVGGEWDSVSSIILENDLIFASIGCRVMAWKAGPVNGHSHSKKSQHIVRSKKADTAKWVGQIELRREINESKKVLEDERANTRKIFAREREQLNTLNRLGLSEQEALEYAMMLSREESRASSSSRATSSTMEEGVFATDEDFPINSGEDISGRSYVSSSQTSTSSKLEDLPQASAIVELEVDQLRTRTNPQTISSSRSPAATLLDDDDFPTVSPSSKSGSLRAGNFNSFDNPAGSYMAEGEGIRRSPQISVSSSPPVAPPRPNAWTSKPASSRSWGSSPTPSSVSSSFERRLPRNMITDDDDADLKYALELSLAEALSSGGQH